ncbi:hypothetical protein LINGRAHAP2_LOCUS6240 [Linum grandiflorum]
MILGIYAITMA